MSSQDSVKNQKSSTFPNKTVKTTPNPALLVKAPTLPTKTEFSYDEKKECSNEKSPK